MYEWQSNLAAGAVPVCASYIVQNHTRRSIGILCFTSLPYVHYVVLSFVQCIRDAAAVHKQQMQTPNLGSLPCVCLVYYYSYTQGRYVRAHQRVAVACRAHRGALAPSRLYYYL